MKILVLIGAIFSVVIATFLIVLSQNAPETAVRNADEPIVIAVKKFTELAELGQIEELKEFSTLAPDSYEPFGSSITRELLKTLPEKEEVRPGVKVLTVGDKPLATWKMHAEMIRENKTYIVSVKQVWINGNKGRVRAILGTRNEVSHQHESDFLLIEENGKWKVFGISLPVLDRWAMPDNKPGAPRPVSERHTISGE